MDTEMVPRHVVSVARNYVTYLNRDELSAMISSIVLSIYFIIKRRWSEKYAGNVEHKGIATARRGELEIWNCFHPFIKSRPLFRGLPLIMDD